MKKIAISLFVLTFAFVSCVQEDDKQIDQNSELKKEIAFNRLTSSVVGYEKDGKIELGVSNSKLMSAFEVFKFKSSLEFEAKSVKLITVENNNYLRFYGENNTTATIELIKGKDNIVKTGNTICQSVIADKSGGCLPEGLYCTKSKIDNTNQDLINDDCKRLTISAY